MLAALPRPCQPLHACMVARPCLGRWHLADAVVVVVSLTLELTLKGVAQEVASLLVFFRCAEGAGGAAQPGSDAGCVVGHGVARQCWLVGWARSLLACRSQQPRCPPGAPSTPLARAPRCSLWRLLRVMHGVAEAVELGHERELERHHRLVHGLQKARGHARRGGCRTPAGVQGQPRRQAAGWTGRPATSSFLSFSALNNHSMRIFMLFQAVAAVAADRAAAARRTWRRSTGGWGSWSRRWRLSAGPPRVRASHSGLP